MEGKDFRDRIKLYTRQSTAKIMAASTRLPRKKVLNNHYIYYPPVFMIMDEQDMIGFICIYMLNVN